MILMNKKGFTLVEILAVIVVLGLIIVIVGTKGFGAFDSVKGKITDMNKKVIVEAANILATEIEHCDDDTDRKLIEKILGVPGKCDDIETELITGKIHL